MYKKILTTAVLAAVASAAHAQSSVTLYGIIDAGITYVNNVRTSTNGPSARFVGYGDGVAQGSRWGLRGSEDLGNGLKAIFVLENGFNSGNGAAGQGNSMFGRQAFVGLSSDNVGSVTFGRQYSFNTDILGGFYSTGNNTVAGNFAYHVNDVDQLSSSRINNSVKYQSANFAGLTFGAMYGFSNQAGAFAGSNAAGLASSRTYSFGGNYAYGPFSVGAAYIDITFPGNTSPTPFTGMLANIGSAGTALKDLRSFGVGGRYMAGPATVWALWTNTMFTQIAAPSYMYNAYEIGGKYAFTPALSAALGYTYSRASGPVTAHWNQVNGVIDYALSKRTDVYGLAIYQGASGSFGTTNVQAQIGDSATSYIAPSGTGSQNQVALRVGIRHKF